MPVIRAIIENALDETGTIACSDDLSYEGNRNNGVPTVQRSLFNGQEEEWIISPQEIAYFCNVFRNELNSPYLVFGEIDMFEGTVTREMNVD
jgi:hypothetical protein